jgi:hypothetical protein
VKTFPIGAPRLPSATIRLDARLETLARATVEELAMIFNRSPVPVRRHVPHWGCAVETQRLSTKPCQALHGICPSPEVTQGRCERIDRHDSHGRRSRHPDKALTPVGPRLHMGLSQGASPPP